MQSWEQSETRRAAEASGVSNGLAWEAREGDLGESFEFSNEDSSKRLDGRSRNMTAWSLFEKEGGISAHFVVWKICWTNYKTWSGMKVIDNTDMQVFPFWAPSHKKEHLLCLFQVEKCWREWFLREAHKEKWPDWWGKAHPKAHTGKHRGFGSRPRWSSRASTQIFRQLILRPRGQEGLLATDVRSKKELDRTPKRKGTGDIYKSRWLAAKRVSRCGGM